MSTTLTSFPFDAMFDRMLGVAGPKDRAFAGRSLGAAQRAALWLPPVDTYETEHALVVEADVPGMDPSQIDIHFEQGTLTISGKRASTLPNGAPNDDAKLRVFASERHAGAFARSIRLPEYVDGEKIAATYANGVLTINIPKAVGALPRKIAVSVANEAA